MTRRASASDPTIVAAVLEAEYGAPADQVFASWEPSRSVASIGQVHRARLADGTDVTVTVQHPGVAESTLADLANLELLVPVLRALDPRLEPGPFDGELRRRAPLVPADAQADERP